MSQSRSKDNDEILKLLKQAFKKSNECDELIKKKEDLRENVEALNIMTNDLGRLIKAYANEHKDSDAILIMKELRAFKDDQKTKHKSEKAKTDPQASLEICEDILRIIRDKFNPMRGGKGNIFSSNAARFQERYAEVMKKEKEEPMQKEKKEKGPGR